MTVPAAGHLALPPLPRMLHTVAISVCSPVLPGLPHLGALWGLCPLPQCSSERNAHAQLLLAVAGPLKTYPQDFPPSWGPPAGHPSPPAKVSAAPQGVCPTLPPVRVTSRWRKHGSTAAQVWSHPRSPHPECHLEGVQEDLVSEQAAASDMPRQTQARRKIQSLVSALRTVTHPPYVPIRKGTRDPS